MSNCDHDHSHHHHSHGLNHENESLNTAFKVSILLNTLFVAVEIYCGYTANSMSLLADAFHNLSDVFSLVISLVGFLFSRRSNGKKISAGISVFNSWVLIFTLAILIYESLERMHNHDVINNNTVMIVAFIGIVINFGSAILFKKHQHHNLNAEGAYLHLMSDAAISLGVVVTAFVIKSTGYTILDAVVSILISLFILYSTVKLLRKSIREYKSCT